MERLAFLGIGSNSLDNLNTSSFAVELDKGQWMLVDCGPDIPRQITKIGIPLLDITYIIVTHSHLDHCLGLPYLLFGRNLERQMRLRQNPAFQPTTLHIIAEKEVWDTLRKLFYTCHPDVQSLGFETEHTDITSFLERPRDVANVQLQTFIMDHSVRAYGLILSIANQKKLAYSTDTLPVKAFMQAASGVEVLIHEAMTPEADYGFSMNTRHSTTKHAGNAISQIHPQRAFLIHIRPTFWNTRQVLEKEVLEASDVQAVYPEEGSFVNFSQLEQVL